MEIPLLQDVLVIFGISVAVLLICLRMGVPTVVGMLITGVICGPEGLRLVEAHDEVEFLAEIGIALLLFSIGIELSLKRFLRSIKQVVLGGAFQGGIVACGALAMALFLGRGWGEAAFLACLLSLSSTAIVLHIFQEKREVRTPHGQMALSILIFQDIVVVPMLLVVPFLAGRSIQVDGELVWVILQGVGLLALVFGAGEWVVPRLLKEVAKAHNFKLFLFTVLFICFAVASLTAWLGLSLALGAFLSGLIISESEYHEHALGNVFPFQEVFTGFFFVSTGMLVDLGFVWDHPFLIVVTLVGVLCLKSFAAGTASVLMGLPLRTCVLVSLALCQVGEFSFVLVKAGIDHGISTPFHYQLFLSVTLFSMVLTPVLMRIAPRVGDLLQSLPWPDRISHGHFIHEEKGDVVLEDHVVLVGFGYCGRNVAKALKTMHIPYVAIDLDPELVSKYKSEGEPIHFGDGSHQAVLNHVGVSAAQSVAILIEDNVAARCIIEEVRKLNPGAFLIVRTHTAKEIVRLRLDGANEVVSDDLESSVEIFSSLLKEAKVSTAAVDRLIREHYHEHYQTKV